MRTGNRGSKRNDRAAGQGKKTDRKSAAARFRAALSGRMKLCAALGGLFIGFSLNWGRQLDEAGNVDFTALSSWGIPLALAVVLTPLLAWGFTALDSWANKRSAGAPTAKWLFIALGLFVAWFPVFLAVYPGFFAYDATDELTEVLTGEYVTRHPLLHVLLLGKTVSGIEKLTGSYNTGIAVYVLCQMVIMALLFSWLLFTIKKLGAGRLLFWLSFVWMAFFPVVPMYVLCTSKDMPFAAGMVSVAALLCLMQKDREGFWKSSAKILGLVVALFVMAVFRNNGFYVFLIMIPASLLLAGKKYWKKMALVALAVLLACIGVNSGLKAILQPVSTDTQETLTVPIQQLARVWNYEPETFSEEEKEALFEILPQEVLERYNPKLSDMVKIDFNAEAYQKDPGRYQRLWLSVGKKAPFTYINAWFMTSYGFWYPFTIIDVYNGTHHYVDSSFFSFETEPPGVRQSRFVLLEKVYRKLSTEVWIQKVPVVSLLFSVGFMSWVYIFAGLYMVATGRFQSFGAFLPVFLNLLTVLLGPTCLVRYVLVYWVALPLLAAQVCAPHESAA